MKKWRVLGLIAAMGAAFAMSGCGQQSTGGSGAAAKKATDGLVIGFSHCCERDQIRTMDAVEDVIRQEAEKAGVKLLFETAEETKHLVKDENGKDTITFTKTSESKDGDKTEYNTALSFNKGSDNNGEYIEISGVKYYKK